MNIRYPFVVFITLIAALQLPLFAHARSNNPVEVDRIVAVVNDEVITMQELQSQFSIPSKPISRALRSIP
mgnify:CR=1 FL=1